MIPIPTHRAMFIGQPVDADHLTCTFRYLSTDGLKSLTSVEGIEFEWKDQLLLFPKAMIIQEINSSNDDEWCIAEGKRKGLGKYDAPIPYPDSDLWFVDQASDAYSMGSTL
jgi:hypothetical protein